MTRLATVTATTGGPPRGAVDSMMPPAGHGGLRRHRLVWLKPSGWQRLVDQDAGPDADPARQPPLPGRDAVSRECLAWWAAHDLPLVVTIQGRPGDGRGPLAPLDPLAPLALGLAAPGRWQRRRIGLITRLADVDRVGDFPLASEIVGHLPVDDRPAWHQLCSRLHERGALARVFGSHGWQRLSGLDHLRAGSDIDLLIAVTDAAQADAVVAVLASFASPRCRIDGELTFDGQHFVAWREWAAARSGRTRELLVKSLEGARLVPAASFRADAPRPLMETCDVIGCLSSVA